MNISKYVLAMLTITIIMPNAVCAMDQAQAEEKQQAEQKANQAQGSANRLADSAQEFAQAAQELRQKREEARKINNNGDQIPWKKVALNAAAMGAGFFSGHLIKTIGVAMHGKIGSDSPVLGCLYLTLMALPFVFASEADAYKSLTGLALIGGMTL